MWEKQSLEELIHCNEQCSHKQHQEHRNCQKSCGGFLLSYFMEIDAAQIMLYSPLVSMLAHSVNSRDKMDVICPHPEEQARKRLISLKSHNIQEQTNGLS